MTQQIKISSGIIFLFFSILFFACNDIIERNISKDKINVLAPIDNYASSSFTVTFWWDELKGAEYYNIQIVKPDFTNISEIVIDSNATSNKATFTLLPGIYQWRVRGANNGYNTEYVTRTLIVDSLGNLADQQMTLISPSDNYYTTSHTNIFKWETIANAQEYRFQVTNNTSGSLIIDENISTDSISVFLNDGSYKWQVRAQNAFSNTLYSSRNIFIDNTVPVVSSLTSPTNNDTILNPVTLSWIRDISAFSDSLYIYSDSLISAPIIKILTQSTSYLFTTGVINQDYFWRLKSFDAAGNPSIYSELRRFWVGP